jgi:hypothetical protein
MTGVRSKWDARRFMRMRQSTDLEVHEVPDGYIVYQKQQDRVHYLNTTAAVIFEFCDGKHHREDVVKLVARLYGLDPSGYDDIRATLDSLIQECLIQSTST